MVIKNKIYKSAREIGQRFQSWLRVSKEEKKKDSFQSDKKWSRWLAVLMIEKKKKKNLDTLYVDIYRDEGGAR